MGMTMRLYTSGPVKQILDIYHRGDWLHFKSGKPVWFTTEPCTTLEVRFAQVAVTVPDTFDVEQYAHTMSDGAIYYVIQRVPSNWKRELVTVPEIHR